MYKQGGDLSFLREELPSVMEMINERLAASPPASPENKDFMDLPPPPPEQKIDPKTEVSPQVPPIALVVPPVPPPMPISNIIPPTQESSKTLTKGDDDVIIVGSTGGDDTKGVPYEVLLKVKMESFEGPTDKPLSPPKEGGASTTMRDQGPGKEKKKFQMTLNKKL